MNGTLSFSITAALVGDPTGKANTYRDSLYLPWNRRLRAPIHVPWSATVAEVRREAARALGISADRDPAPDLVPFGSKSHDDLAWYDNIPPGGYTFPPVVDDLGLVRWLYDDFPFRYWLNAHALAIPRYAGDLGRVYLVIAEPNEDTFLEEPPEPIVEWSGFCASYKTMRRMVTPVALAHPRTWQGGAAANIVRFVSVLRARVARWASLGASPYEFADLVVEATWDADVLRRLLDLQGTEAEDVLRATGHSLVSGKQWQVAHTKTAQTNRSLLWSVMLGLFPESDADVLARWQETINGIEHGDPEFVS